MQILGNLEVITSVNAVLIENVLFRVADVQ